VANILIVDDDPAVQLKIRLLLERAGHHVTVAGDGRLLAAVDGCLKAGESEGSDVNASRR
jgi:CheY-like chemotaxis protein